MNSPIVPYLIWQMQKRSIFYLVTLVGLQLISPMYGVSATKATPKIMVIFVSYSHMKGGRNYIYKVSKSG